MFSHNFKAIDDSGSNCFFKVVFMVSDSQILQ